MNGFSLKEGVAQEAALRVIRLIAMIGAAARAWVIGRSHPLHGISCTRWCVASSIAVLAVLTASPCAHASPGQNPQSNPALPRPQLQPPTPTPLKLPAPQTRPAPPATSYTWRLADIPRSPYRDIARRTGDEFWHSADLITQLAIEQAALPAALATIACARPTSWQPWPPTPVALISKPCIQSLAADPRLMYRDIERRTFEYFWNTADPVSGLAPDHWPSDGPSSIAAVGFALTADVIGADRGYVSRHAAAARVLQVLTFLLSRPQGPGPKGFSGYHGLFYHFLDIHTGLRYRESELSTIDTALLMAGVLTAESYFDHPTPTETQVRTVADQLYRRVNWGWAAPGVDPLVSMAWFPRKGFSKARWAGYNEASILYILGLGSPTYPLRNNAWSAWTATTGHDWRQLDGQTLLAFGAQFVFQYTAVWVDLRGIADPLMRAHDENYFVNGRRATLAQRQYAIDNPNDWAGYGPDIWGLTACNGPGYVRAPFRGRMRQFYGYAARGITSRDQDDGTLAPTAVLGSLPFAPEYVTQATQALLRQYGDILYTRYGFLDSFNPSFTHARLAMDGYVVPGRGWVDNEFLGIDQGPIIAMIENQRSGLIWRVMRRNPYVRAGLQRAEFTGGWFDPGTPESPVSTPPADTAPAQPTAATDPQKRALTSARPADPSGRPAVPE